MRLDAIILMGNDVGTPEKINERILRRQASDGEIYFEGFNKYDIELFGEKLGRIYLKVLDKSMLISDKVIVVGNHQVEKSLPDYTKGLSKKYLFVQQGRNRFENILLAIDYIGRNGLHYISGADMPQIDSIDARIAEFGEPKAANLLFGRIEALGTFWRSPFFLVNDTGNCKRKRQDDQQPHNKGYKEPTDYIIDTQKIDLSKIEKMEIMMKLDSFSEQAKLAGRVLKAFKNETSWKEAFEFATEIGKIMVSYFEFRKINKSKHYPKYKSARLSEIIRFAADYIGISKEDINVRESYSATFYKDLDSLQDVFRHAKEMMEQKTGAGNITYQSLKPFITYNGIPILEHDKFKKNARKTWYFFQGLQGKENKMRYLQKYGKILYNN